jgi:hypothetical protein
MQCKWFGVEAWIMANGKNNCPILRYQVEQEHLKNGNLAHVALG